MAAACFPSFAGLSGGEPEEGGTRDAAYERGDAPSEDDGEASLETGPETDADTNGDDAQGAVDADRDDGAPDALPVCESGVSSRNSTVCSPCGRDCEKGECIAGECQPFVVIAQTNGQPTQLAVNETHIYWTTLGTPASDATSALNEGKVMRAARDGSAITTIADRQQHPTGLLLTSDHVYWVNQGGVGESGQFGSNDGSVKGISLDGSSGQVTIASSQRRPVALATDGATKSLRRSD